MVGQSEGGLSSDYKEEYDAQLFAVFIHIIATRSWLEVRPIHLHMEES